MSVFEEQQLQCSDNTGRMFETVASLGVEAVGEGAAAPGDILQGGDTRPKINFFVAELDK